MSSVFRKLAGLPRRLLCLPRRSDVDLTDGLPVTPAKRTETATRDPKEHTGIAPLKNSEDITTVNRPETQSIVTPVSERVADVRPANDIPNTNSGDNGVVALRKPSHRGSADDLREASFSNTVAFTRTTTPPRSRTLPSSAPQFDDPSWDKETKTALRELSELAIRSPKDFVSRWRAQMDASSTDTVKNPHVIYLALMDLCAVDSYFSSESAKTEDLWSAMTVSGVAEACTTYLRKYPGAQWRMVTGLTNIIICLQSACVPPDEVERARASFMPFFAQYWTTLWGNRKLLIEDDPESKGESAEKARRAVHVAMSTFFSVLWRNPTHYSYWKRDDFSVFLRVMLLNWMYSTNDDVELEEKESYLVLMTTLFSKFKSTTQLTEDDRRAFVHGDIVGEYGAQKYLARVCITIRTFKDVDTVSTVLDTNAKMISHSDFHPYLVSSGVFQAIRDTADLPLAQSSNKDALWVVHKAILVAYCRILNSAPVHQAAKPLLRTYDVFDLIARASISFVSVHNTEKYNCFCTVREVLAVYTVIGGGAQAHSKKDALVNTIQQSLRPHWYRTIRDLGRIAECNTFAAQRCARVTDVWKALGLTLGLNEEEEKVEFEKEMKRLERLCAWKECQYHNTEPPTATRSCAGCREVRYCSRTCQQKDWKEGGHKLRCRRLKSEPHAPRSPQASCNH